ncbi:uncharacterized protein B0T15DRAFT_231918 [Chaetomium strumarium]|uniref:Zn(2)-C6 fungal-type domain-containing protein n=1 Tax=Chaetomium strumarium TaxID=1170767 RepID=A0AAJ0GQ96_9PEZI|nr:hypothetical protein B0T15DRAFT_231918 [Chaetomium strumarium]
MSGMTKPGPDCAGRRKRVQVSKACHRCRRLQKGCSETRPCQRCVRVGLEDQCSSTGRKRGEERAQQPLDGRAWLSYPQLPASLSPETLYATNPLVGRLDVEQPRCLPPNSVVIHCTRAFFARLYPTIPILSNEYVDMLVEEAESIESPRCDEAQCLLTALCAVVLIQVEAPAARLFEADGILNTNADFGRILFEKAMAARNRLSLRFNPCLERALATFFLYAGHASLFHHSQAFCFLREAATLWMVLRVDERDVLRRRLADRLFWVILISERAHGIRYRRPLTLQVTPSQRPDLGDSDTATSADDLSLSGLRCLVALFYPLDTTFFALLNQESTPALASSALLIPLLDGIQASIRNALEPQQTKVLCETQLANLRVTQLWLLVILWQLRLRLGLLVEEPGVPCHLAFHYPVEVGDELVGVLRTMSLESMRVHGVGINEKIFDVACAMADVLSRVLTVKDSGGASALENIRCLRRLIHHLPGGESTYDALLDEHISNTLPNMLDNDPGSGKAF